MSWILMFCFVSYFFRFRAYDRITWIQIFNKSVPRYSTNCYELDENRISPLISHSSLITPSEKLVFWVNRPDMDAPRSRINSHIKSKAYCFLLYKKNNFTFTVTMELKLKLIETNEWIVQNQNSHLQKGNGFLSLWPRRITFQIQIFSFEIFIIKFV